MRLLLPTALGILALLKAPGQDNIPLPEKDGPPALPLEPQRPESDPGPSSGLPRVELAPATPAFPHKAIPAPRVRMTPKSPVSESSVYGGQFKVHGKSKEQRDTLLDAAETTRRMVVAALRQESNFSFPIVVQIRETSALRPGEPEVWSSISQTPGGFRFEINLVPQRNAVDGPLLRKEFVRCILAEMLLRGHAGVDMSNRVVPPPDWLLHGVLELMDYQSLGRQSEAFSAVFRLGRVLSIDDIFAADPGDMDSVSLMIYRSSCCGLLLLLMEQQNGAQQLAELFKTLALAPGDDATAIARAYPKLSESGNSLGKWWSLQLAAMAQPGMDELLGPQDTAAELVRALVLEIPPEPVTAAKKQAKSSPFSKIFGKRKKDVAEQANTASSGASECPIEEYARILARDDRGQILARVDLALTKLGLRGHPIYRPVIAEYRSLIKALSDGKKEKEAAASFAALARLRGKLKSDMQAAEDYLNWYEATQTEGISDAFHDYIRTADQLESPLPPRRDSLTRYMNLIEQEYQPDE